MVGKFEWLARQCANRHATGIGFVPAMLRLKVISTIDGIEEASRSSMQDMETLILGHPRLRIWANIINLQEAKS